MSRALIVGCGYTGLRLGARLAGMGVPVWGTTRRADRSSELSEAGIAPIVGSLEERETLRALDRAAPTAIFYLAPPQIGSDPLESVLRSLGRAPLEAFVYASSTSVYGDRGGAWVDETTRPEPVSESGRAREAGERAALELGWRHQAPIRIGRIAGIYGPGRTLRDRLARGEYRLIRGLDACVNRIHVDDLVEGLIAMWRKGTNGRIYNLVDDLPHRSSEFALLAAELHGLPAPARIERTEAEASYARARWARKAADKRVSNARLRQELGVVLRYPTYREGLRAAIGEERGSERR